MNNFEFYNPVNVIFGAGEVKRVGEEAKKIGKNVMLVSYKEYSFMSELLEKITGLLKAEGIEVTPFYETTANPTMDQVQAGVDLAKEKGADMLIAVGGGSVIDATKLIAAGVEYKGELWNMINSRHDGSVASVPPETALPTIMIPTITATASEMNCGAVVTNTKTHEKSYLFAGCVYPKVAIMDPELTTTLPAYQTACGAADAISHVLELYLESEGESPVQERFMEGIIITIMDEVKKVLAKPTDVVARGHLQWAICLAWNGWTMPGFVPYFPLHFLAHPLSARFNVTHGATLAIVMPAWMKYSHQNNSGRYIQLAEKVFGLDASTGDFEAVIIEMIKKFENFLSEIGVETTLSECEIPESAIDELVDDAFRIAAGPDGNIGAKGPINKDQAKEIMKLAL